MAWVTPTRKLDRLVFGVGRILGNPNVAVVSIAIAKPEYWGQMAGGNRSERPGLRLAKVPGEPLHMDSLCTFPAPLDTSPTPLRPVGTPETATLQKSSPCPTLLRTLDLASSSSLQLLGLAGQRVLSGSECHWPTERC